MEKGDQGASLLENNHTTPSPYKVGQRLLDVIDYSIRPTEKTSYLATL